MSRNMRREGFAPKKQSRPIESYGISQNFLTSARIINRLVSIAGIGKSDHILEIGAGKGHITRVLADRAGSVSAVEIDPKLYSGLLKLFSGTGNLHIIKGDFLRTKLPDSDYKIFANIPFCRTSEIIKKLIFTKNQPLECWLIMEKGAAKRFSGRPCENKSSLLLKPFYEIDIAYHFSRGDFHPAPSVDVVMLRMIKKAVPDLSQREFAKYQSFIETCQKAGIRKLLTKGEISEALRRKGLPEIPLSGNMLYVQWLCLFRRYASGKTRF